MNEIKLSIIIPHYNDLKRVTRCINSIPVRDDVEIIVVDDHSADEVLEAIKSNENIKVLSNTKYEHSAGTCRNIGLRQAKGKWILFADADDYFAPCMYDAVSAYFDSDNEIVFFKGNSFWEDSGEQSVRHLGFSNRIDAYIKNPGRKEELSLRLLCEPWLKLIRRDIIEKYDIRFEEIFRSNDVKFSTELGYYAKKITADANEIYYISDDPKSLSRTDGEASFYLRKKVLVWRHIFWYKHLNKNECLMLGMRYNALRLVLSPVRNRYGIKMSKEFYHTFLENKVPLIIV